MVGQALRVCGKSRYSAQDVEPGLLCVAGETGKPPIINVEPPGIKNRLGGKAVEKEHQTSLVGPLNHLNRVLRVKGCTSAALH